MLHDRKENRYKEHMVKAFCPSFLSLPSSGLRRESVERCSQRRVAMSRYQHHIIKNESGSPDGS